MMPRRASAAVLAALAIAVPAGCGGGDDERGGGGDGANRPTPREPIGAVMPRLKTAVEQGDCEERAKLFLHSSFKPVGQAIRPSEDDCAKYEEFAEFLTGFEPGVAQEYGTAAVVDGKTDETPAKGSTSGLWILDRDGSWKGVFFGTSDTPQINQTPRDPEAFDRAAKDFFDAARSRDCGRVFGALSAESRYVTARKGDRADFCADLRAAYEQRKGQLFEIAEHGDGPPQKLGATRDLGFYGLELKNGRYLTVVVMVSADKGQTGPARVWDFFTARDAS